MPSTRATSPVEGHPAGSAASPADDRVTLTGVKTIGFRGVNVNAAVELESSASSVGGHDTPRHQVRDADEACHEGRPRTFVNLFRRRQLLDHTVVHHRDLI